MSAFDGHNVYDNVHVWSVYSMFMSTMLISLWGPWLEEGRGRGAFIGGGGEGAIII